MSHNHDILLIEPDPDLAELTSGALQRYGFVVTVAGNVAEADYYLRHRAFDATVSEFHLEGRDAEKSWGDIGALHARAPMMPFGLVSATEIRAEQIATHGISFALHEPVSTHRLVTELVTYLPVDAVLPADRHATIQVYFTSLERSDWDRLESICTEDVVYDLPADSVEFRATVAGRQAFRRLTEETFSRCREPRFAMKSLRALPRGAVVRYEGSWSDVSGSRVTLPGAVLFRFLGDHIAEVGIRVEPR